MRDRKAIARPSPYACILRESSQWQLTRYVSDQPGWSAGAAMQEPHPGHAWMEALVFFAEGSEGRMRPGSVEDAAQEHLRCLSGLEGLHATQPRAEAHAEALHSSLATRQPELSLPHVAMQHADSESPPVHDCSQHRTVEIRVCVTVPGSCHHV